MNLADIRLRVLDGLTADEGALLRCRLAADLIHDGQFEGAREALGELWRGTGARPNVEDLGDRAAAEVLMQCGSLSGWLGTSKRVEGAQEAAKDLVGEALRIFAARGQNTKVAEAQYELGMCYWRSGALGEARVILQEALGALGEFDLELRAKILIRSTLVEISAGRYNDALRMLDTAESVFGIAPDALKGRWHGQRALVLRRLGTAEKRADYFDRALIEYTASIFHFEQARHERYCGNAENNLAFLLYKLGRYAEAHEHLDRAQAIFKRLDDSGNLAQVGETRARVFLAQGHYRKAADVIGGAVGALERAGEMALLADALTVQATVEARLGDDYNSMPTFRRAVNTAEDAGAFESAGLAALSLMEEHGASRLPERELYSVYFRADELLRQTQDAEAVERLRACARLVAQRLWEVTVVDGFKLPEAVRAYEAKFIRRALEEAQGSVTHASKRLGISYQRLANLLKTRHRDLSSARKPMKPRRQSAFKKIVKDQ